MAILEIRRLTDILFR